MESAACYAAGEPDVSFRCPQQLAYAYGVGSFAGDTRPGRSPIHRAILSLAYHNP